MGKRGRFGKYGEFKRISRLRAGKANPFCAPGRQIMETGKAGIQKIHTPPKGNVTVRVAESSDVDFVRDLSERVFQQYGPYEKTLARWFASGITVTFLAVLGDKPVGFAMLGEPNYTWSFSPICELLAIAVAPEKRRLHVADLLMNKLEGTAHEFKVDRLILHTSTENAPARRLFEKHHFIPAQIEKVFYPKGQDALMMYKELS
mgnify:CR=1 FL=1